MLFNSFQFIFVFLPAAWVSYVVIAHVFGRRAGVGTLVASSLVFYGWWNAQYLGILLVSIGCNAIVAIALLRARSKYRGWILGAGLGFNLLLLGYFKYVSFIAANLGALVGATWSVESPSLPLGISFFTFQKIAFLIDVYAGGVVGFDLLHYCLFVTFFPQLIAGPIVHHREIIPQLARMPTAPQARNVAIGASIFAIGLFKKMCLADPSAALAAPVFSAADAGASVGFADAWVAAGAYAFQIYFDFSGYTDMAVGLARLFGIVLPINFFSPYKAVNIVEFWRRWHITLSRFLRDSVYIPLGGNRLGTPRRYLNLLTTMLIGGLWHGASWTFVAWGAVHGLMLVMNHGWHYVRRRIGWPTAERPGTAGRVIACAVTFVAVTTAWVFFRASSLDAAGRILAAMYGLGAGDVTAEAVRYAGDEWRRVLRVEWSESRALWLLAVGAVAFLLPNTSQLFRRFRSVLIEQPVAPGWAGSRLRWTPDWRWAVGVSLLLLAAMLRMRELSPFIYFQF